MPSVPINGFEMHYDEAGKGLPVVLLHGFPLDRRIWTAQLEELSGRYRVVTPDLRGFGASHDQAAFTMESLADDVHGFLQTVGALPCVLGGLSMGGYICFAYLRKYPADLKGLMLVNTRPEADPPAVRANRDKTARQALTEGLKPIVDAMLPRLLSPKSRRPALAVGVREILGACPARTVANASMAMRDRPDSTNVLGSIVVPTLVIAGEDDPIIPVEEAVGMHEAIAGSRMVLIPGAAHLTPMEQPHQVTRAMRGFLEGIGI